MVVYNTLALNSVFRHLDQWERAPFYEVNPTVSFSQASLSAEVSYSLIVATFRLWKLGQYPNSNGLVTDPDYAHMGGRIVLAGEGENPRWKCRLVNILQMFWGNSRHVKQLWLAAT